MANYDPNRPRPSIDATAALPGDALAAGSSARDAEVDPATRDPVEVDPAEVEAAESDPVEVDPAGVDPAEVDPVPGPASRLLPRQAEPVDRRWLAALVGAAAVGALAAVAVAWWLWHRRRGR